MCPKVPEDLWWELELKPDSKIGSHLGQGKVCQISRARLTPSKNSTTSCNQHHLCRKSNLSQEWTWPWKAYLCRCALWCRIWRRRADEGRINLHLRSDYISRNLDVELTIEKSDKPLDDFVNELRRQWFLGLIMTGHLLENFGFPAPGKYKGRWLKVSGQKHMTTG